MDINSVYKVYSGQAGKCMCGCAGKYSYTAEGAVKHNPGYEPNVNERSVKIIAGRVLRNPNARRAEDHVYVEENGRIMVAWFA